MTTRPHYARTLSGMAALLFVGAALAGCVTDTAQAGTAEIYVKDNLTEDAAEVHVTFVQADVLPADGGGWVTVFEGEETIELLALNASDAKAQLAALDIEAGEYREMRITVTNVTVVGHDGNTTELPTFGNVVTIAKDLTVRPDGTLKVLIDFDLESGVDLAAGHFSPVVKDVQTNAEDADGDGVDDFEDTDDDGDGIEDALDEDRDGDGKPDHPQQSHAMDRRGIHGLCTAWGNNAEGRTNGTAGNATAFQWLQNRSADAGQDVEAYCEDNARQPGPPGELAGLVPAHVDLPEQARGPPSDRGAPGGNETRGPPSDSTRGPPSDRGGAGDNRTDDNDSGDGNATASDRNETRGPPSDTPRGPSSGQNGTDANGTSDENDTAAEGNETDGGA